jgi:hypothetical protein
MTTPCRKGDMPKTGMCRPLSPYVLNHNNRSAYAVFGLDIYIYIYIYIYTCYEFVQPKVILINNLMICYVDRWI